MPMYRISLYSTPFFLLFLSACTLSLIGPSQSTSPASSTSGIIAGSLDTSFGSGTGKLILGNFGGLGAASNDAGFALALDSSKRLVIAGVTTNATVATQGYDALAIRLSSDGVID